MESELKKTNYKWISNIKNYYYFISLLAFDQYSGYDHIILINEYLRNFDVIMSKYVKKKINEIPLVITQHVQIVIME